jgi:hypothetical protein
MVENTGKTLSGGTRKATKFPVYIGHNSQGDGFYVASREPLTWVKHAVTSGGSFEPVKGKGYAFSPGEWTDMENHTFLAAMMRVVMMDRNEWRELIRPRGYPTVIKVRK